MAQQQDSRADAVAPSPDAGPPESFVSALAASLPSPWLLLPIPLLFVVIVSLYAVGADASHDSAVLLSAFNALFCTAPALAVAFIGARSYLNTGAGNVLAMGCGALVLGLGSLLAGPLITDPNHGTTVHNIATVTSGALFVAAAAWSLHDMDRARRLCGPRINVVLAYAGALLFMGALTSLTVSGLVPSFFVAGRGSTAIRGVVLGLGAAEYLAAAVLFFSLARRTGSRFAALAGASFALTGVALGALVLSGAAPGSPISWVARFGQWLGGVYLLVAVLRLQGSASHWAVSLEAALRSSEDRYRQLVALSPDAVLLLSDGRIRAVNPAAVRLFGASAAADLVGTDIAARFHPDDRDATFQLSEDASSGMVGVSREVRLLRVDGGPVDAEVVWAHVDDDAGSTIQMLVQDVGERKRRQALLLVRLALSEGVGRRDLGALLQRTLDEAERLTESTIGFFHFLDDDQTTLQLQTWSTNTLENMCTAEGKGSHYSVNEAGVWADCVRECRPVVHNDYASLAHRKGLPPGHAPVVRELAVPVVHDNRIAAVIGVGNKPTPYDPTDVETLSQLGSLSWDIVLRERAEAALREAAERYASITDGAMDAYWAVDPEGRLVDVNEAACRLYGYSRDEMLALSVSDLDVDESSEAVNEHQRRVFEAGGDRFEAHHRRKDGTAFDVEVSARSWGTTGISVFVHDITERKQREQAQRLESLGVLAGGIAHDFNNILTAVIGNAELALADLPPSSPSRVHIVEIAHASRRAADLSQQMLAFSGRGRFVIEPVDLSALVRQLSDLLRSTISKRTALVVNLAVDLPRVQGDASQLSQLIMNLVLNASEAIGDRDGSVTVSTQAIDWPDDLVVESSSLLTLAPGTYVRFEVSDTGCGMDEETRQRMFEPFFTTKFTGRGLGLAAVQGIVRGHQGGFTVASRSGHGTTFTVLFPVAEVAAESAAADVVPAHAWQGHGLVLLVDDEEAIRTLGTRMLARLGFEVLTAADGLEAVAIYRARGAEIRGVVLDLTMPRMDGAETLGELRDIDPAVPVIMSSGYDEQEVSTLLARYPSVGFVQKPYALDDLREQFRRWL